MLRHDDWIFVAFATPLLYQTCGSMASGTT